MSLFGAISGGISLVGGLLGLSSSNKTSSSAAAGQEYLAKIQGDTAAAILDRYNTKYWPLEDLYIDYAMKDVQTLRPSYENQVDYYAQRLDEQLALAKELNPQLDETQKSLIRKLVEGEDVLADRLRSQATADIGSAYGSQREQDMRSMGLAGINPNSGQMQNYINRMGQSQALAEAGARTQASRNAEDISIQRQATALGYYKNAELPEYSTNSSGTSLGNVSQLASNASNIYSGLASQSNNAMQNINTGLGMLSKNSDSITNAFNTVKSWF